MINKAKIQQFLTLSFAIAGLMVFAGIATETNAQRDPFAKPGWARTKEPGKGGVRTGPGAKTTPEFTPWIPSIDQRIEYFKRLREEAATNGQPLPKVTSVIALDEMQVTGIFRTPRGYAAMVEATPIKLSYTIDPGEKFFDGQLVAVEENRLVFRKVTKTAKGKFATTVENKPLRKYTQREQIQGTAPTGAETMAQGAAPVASDVLAAAPAPVISPLDEMNRQPEQSDEKKSTSAKKPVRVARNKNQ